MVIYKSIKQNFKTSKSTFYSHEMAIVGREMTTSYERRLQYDT